MSRFFRYQILAGLLGFGYTSIQIYHRPYWTQIEKKQCWVAPTLTIFHAQLSGVEFWGLSKLHIEELDNSSFLRKNIYSNTTYEPPMAPYAEVSLLPI